MFVALSDFVAVMLTMFLDLSNYFGEYSVNGIDRSYVQSYKIRSYKF